MKMKRCTKCGQSKALADFSRDSRAKDGLDHKCKQCRHVYYESRRATVIEQARAYQKAHLERERERHRVYRAAHLDEKREYQRAYYAAHPEANREYERIYNASHVEERRESGRVYQKAHPEVPRACTARRRARKASAFGTDYTTSEMIAARWEMWDGMCWLCGKPATDTDHVKPLKKGGAHLPCNMRPICSKCNSSKGATWPYVVLGVL